MAQWVVGLDISEDVDVGEGILCLSKRIEQSLPELEAEILVVRGRARENGTS